MLKAIGKFFLSFLTAIKEDGDNSPFSMRRIALGFMIYFAYISLIFGLQSAFMAGSSGADWKVVALMIAPFAICVVTIIVIVIRLTATDIQMIVEAGKNGTDKTS